MRFLFIFMCLMFAVAPAAGANNIEELTVPPRIVKEIKIVASVRGVPIYQAEVFEAVCRRQEEWIVLPSYHRLEKIKRLYQEETRRLIERELILDNLFSTLKTHQRESAWEMLFDAATKDDLLGLLKQRQSTLDRLKNAATTEADKRLQHIQTMCGSASENGVDDLLNSQGLTRAGLRRHFERGFMMAAFVGEVIRPKFKYIDEDDLRDYYHKHPEEFQIADSVKWQNLFVRMDNFQNKDEARKYAEWLMNRAKKEDFAKLVEYDQGISKSNCGFGFGEKQGEINPPELEQVIFAMKKGDVTIVDFESGFHVIRIAERTYAGRQGFSDADVQRKIGDILKNQLAECEYQEMLTLLWEQAKYEEIVQGGKLEFHVDERELRRFVDRFPARTYSTIEPIHKSAAEIELPKMSWQGLSHPVK